MSCKYTKLHLYQLEGRDDKYIRNPYLCLVSPDGSWSKQAGQGIDCVVGVRQPNE
jgi:hypothetical protein